ncbi:MAG: hypothetical protein CL691_00300 [Cellvibrionales bacterium]|nr:hypothetical protein [Cellvibrionales bacterium]|tara:strand:+ start:260 stop:667 length:408 start_codon:yes stop_codon:yes gene_type:complete
MTKNLNTIIAALTSFTMSCQLMAESEIINISALSGAYYINDIRQKALVFNVGSTYTFTGYSEWHPVSLSATADGIWQNGENYFIGVRKQSDSLSVIITDKTPPLFYYCDHHPDMGGKISIKNSKTSHHSIHTTKQ